MQALRAGIISGHSLGDIPAERIQHLTQILGAAFYILLLVIRIDSQ